MMVHIFILSVSISTIFRERNIPEQVVRISPRFQNGIRTFSDSPIIGEVSLFDQKLQNNLYQYLEWAFYV